MRRTVTSWVSDSEILRSTILFVLAGISEIGGAYLFWQAVREGGGVWLAALGGLLLVLYGAVVTLQPDIHFGRILAAYGVSSSRVHCRGASSSIAFRQIAMT